eukprot:5648853-Karenia_brevis.AAC.1
MHRRISCVYGRASRAGQKREVEVLESFVTTGRSNPGQLRVREREIGGDTKCYHQDLISRVVDLGLEGLTARQSWRSRNQQQSALGCRT